MNKKYTINNNFLIIILLLLHLGVSAKTNYDFDLIKKGQDNNNTMLVIGGIQGDEPGGFVAASLLATHYEIIKGSLWIVPNLNFYSIIKRSRGPYGDMNRKFALLSPKDPEYEIVKRIKNYIKDESVKLVINLHDGSGYYRPTHEDKLHSPHRWGQCSIIDQSKIDIKSYGNLLEISSKVVAHVNKHLIKKEDIYHTHNTRTVEGDKEMQKSLTYYALNEGKAAFGNEASKNLPTHKRVYYHLLALEKYMDIVGIEYKRKFELNPKAVDEAINNDIEISFYDGKIKLPLSEIRNIVKYFPIKKDAIVDFKASNPLLAVIKKGDSYTIQYGNRRLSKLKADYQAYDDEVQKVEMLIDGALMQVEFGTVVDVEENFLIKENENYRVNVIGYTNSSRLETGVKIRKRDIPKRFSIDKRGSIYRVEYYKDKKFAGMILVKFQR